MHRPSPLQLLGHSAAQRTHGHRLHRSHNQWSRKQQRQARTVLTGGASKAVKTGTQTRFAVANTGIRALRDAVCGCAVALAAPRNAHRAHVCNVHITRSHCITRGTFNEMCRGARTLGAVAARKTVVALAGGVLVTITTTAARVGTLRRRNV